MRCRQTRHCPLLNSRWPLPDSKTRSPRHIFTSHPSCTHGNSRSMTFGPPASPPYLPGGGGVETAARTAASEFPRTTSLYDRRNQEPRSSGVDQASSASSPCSAAPPRVCGIRGVKSIVPGCDRSSPAFFTGHKNASTLVGFDRPFTVKGLFETCRDGNAKLKGLCAYMYVVVYTMLISSNFRAFGNAGSPTGR